MVVEVVPGYLLELPILEDATKEDVLDNLQVDLEAQGVLEVLVFPAVLQSIVLEVLAVLLIPVDLDVLVVHLVLVALDNR